MAKQRQNGGRKSLTNELIRAAVINKSWEYLAKVMDDEDADAKIKLDIALRLCPKNIPQNMDITSGGEKIYNWGNYGESNSIRTEALDKKLTRKLEEVESSDSTQESGQDSSSD